jgi:rare lipoprotein A
MLIGTGLATLLAGGTVVSVASLADTTPATVEVATTTVNVDSLYTALAVDENVADTSTSIELEPQRKLNGHASWYGPGFHGRKTANGERFDQNEMTAAHKTLPFGSLVRVIDEKTGKSLLVRINDRGPYVRGRLLDLSEAAARRLGIKGRGTGDVRLEVHTPKECAPNMSFDIDGRATISRGYAVRVSRTNSFDEAINLQHKLTAAGVERVLLTRATVDGKTEYQVSVGLFSTERLAESLLAEMSGTYSSATLIRFDAGRPVEQTIAEN